MQLTVEIDPKLLAEAKQLTDKQGTPAVVAEAYKVWIQDRKMQQMLQKANENIHRANEEFKKRATE